MFLSDTVDTAGSKNDGSEGRRKRYMVKVAENIFSIQPIKSVETVFNC